MKHPRSNVAVAGRVDRAHLGKLRSGTRRFFEFETEEMATDFITKVRKLRWESFWSVLSSHSAYTEPSDYTENPYGISDALDVTTDKKRLASGLTMATQAGGHSRHRALAHVPQADRQSRRRRYVSQRQPGPVFSKQGREYMQRRLCKSRRGQGVSHAGEGEGREEKSDEPPQLAECEVSTFHRLGSYHGGAKAADARRSSQERTPRMRDYACAQQGPRNEKPAKELKKLEKRRSRSSRSCWSCSTRTYG